MVMKATRTTIQVAHYIAFDCDEIFTTNNQHYEKLCAQKPHYLAITTLKQLICNYVTSIPWKYGPLKNTMPHWEFVEFYYNCILVPRWICIHMNVCTIYTILVNHV
jgi:hypothetical protein